MFTAIALVILASPASAATPGVQATPAPDVVPAPAPDSAPAPDAAPVADVAPVVDVAPVADVTPVAAVEAAPAAKVVAAPAPVISVTGQVRLRTEVFSEADLNDAATHPVFDDERFLLRTRLTFKASPNEKVTIFIQAQDSRTYGTEPSTAASLAGVDMHQAYLQINKLGGHNAALQVGRMELSYGDQRLLGAFGWHNVGRAFDGVRLQTDGLLHGDQKIDIFYARLRQDRSSGTRGLGDDFAGVYKTTKLSDDMTVDGYGFYLHDKGGGVDTDGDGVNDADRFPGGGRLHLATIGARFDGDVATGLHINAEAALQVGVRGDLDVFAFATHADVGYRLTSAGSPGVHGGVDVASGDSDPTDGSWNTFENLFPTNHLYYGYLDMGAWKNTQSVHVGASVKPNKKSLVKAEVHALMRMDANDTFYRASGAALRPAASITGVDSKYVGTELDLFGKWAFNPNLKFLGGLSYMLPGTFLNDTGGGDAPTPVFGYFQMVGSF